MRVCGREWSTLGRSLSVFVVPALRRDPYAVCSRLGSVADAFLHNPRQGLWVPAFAGTTWMNYRDSHTPPHSRDSICPSFAKFICPKKKRAQGRPGARRTRDLMCKTQIAKNAHEHTGSAEAVRPSLRNGFTAYSVLSPATGLSCHRRQRIAPST